MRVLFVLEGFFPENRAGTESYVKNVSKYFISKGWEISVVIASKEERDFTYFYEGIPVYGFYTDITNRQLLGLDSSPDYSRFVNLLKKINPDIVHFNTLGKILNHLAIQATKKAGFHTVFTPHVAGTICFKGYLNYMDNPTCDGLVERHKCLACTFHSKKINPFFAHIFASISNAALKIKSLKKRLPLTSFSIKYQLERLEVIQGSCDVIIAIAPWIEQILQKNGITNTILVEQGIDEIYLQEAPKKVFKNAKLVIGFIGRITPIKGFDILSQAFLRFPSDKIELHIATLKDENTSDFFSSNKSILLNRSNVIWKENLPPRELIKFLEDIDVLVVPSRSEMAPLVVYEAYSQKVPVLGSNIPAISSLIKENETGWLFKSIDDLVKKLEYLIMNKYKLNEIYQKIERPISFSQVGEKLEKIYTSILKQSLINSDKE